MPELARSKQRYFRTYPRHTPKHHGAVNVFVVNCWEVVQLAGLQILNVDVILPFLTFQHDTLGVVR
jgi:hypothetical protein